MGTHDDTLDGSEKNIVLTGKQNNKQNYPPAVENAPDNRTGHVYLACVRFPSCPYSQLFTL